MDNLSISEKLDQIGTWLTTNAGAIARDDETVHFVFKHKGSQEWNGTAIVSTHDLIILAYQVLSKAYEATKVQVDEELEFVDFLAKSCAEMMFMRNFKDKGLDDEEED